MKTFRKMLAITLAAVIAVLLMPAIDIMKVNAMEGPIIPNDGVWLTIGTSDCQYKIETSGSKVTLTIGPTNGTSEPCRTDAHWLVAGRGMVIVQRLPMLSFNLG